MECRVKEDEAYQLSLLPFWSDTKVIAILTVISREQKDKSR